MRWENFSDGPRQGPADAALFGADAITTRTFDTPEFAGMTFHEIRARSIVNRVPGASGKRPPPCTTEEVHNGGRTDAQWGGVGPAKVGPGVRGNVHQGGGLPADQLSVSADTDRAPRGCHTCQEPAGSSSQALCPSAVTVSPKRS